MRRCPLLQTLLLSKQGWIAIPQRDYDLSFMTCSKIAFQNKGRLWMRHALSTVERTRLLSIIAGPDRPGARIALTQTTRQLLKDCDFVQKITSTWPGMRLVRMVGFAKNVGTNWGVPWHQDRIIAVDERQDVPGYLNWSKKGAVWHCEPPEDILREMLFVRVHIDANTVENGAMEIARGSHEQGLVPSRDAEQVARSYPLEVTIADAGDVLVLPMLCLHRSGASQTSQARRVLRIDFAPRALPTPLKWSS